MTASSFDLFWPRLLDEEGRTLDTDRRDPGNWTGGSVGVGALVGTKFGIDAASHASEVDIPSLTENGAKAIYRRSYATPVHFDDLRTGIDVVVFDSAVNSGVQQAALWLQRACGATADGVIGPKTIAVANSNDVAGVITRVCGQRLAFLQGLAIWPVYGVGWTRRVESLQGFALALASSKGTVA